MVDVRYPKWLLDVKGEFYTAIRYPEFTAQIARVPEGDRAEVSEVARRADRSRQPVQRRRAPTACARIPAAGRCSSARPRAAARRTIATRPSATSVCRLIRAVVEGMLASQQLDAIVYPTASRRPALIAALPPGAGTTTASALSAAGLAASDIANLTGFPDLIVPAGFTGDSLPVGTVIPRPRVQRAEAARARLQLRAGDQSAAPPDPHAAQSRRHNYRTGSTGNASAIRSPQRAINCGALVTWSRILPVFLPGCRASAHSESVVGCR